MSAISSSLRMVPARVNSSARAFAQTQQQSSTSNPSSPYTTAATSSPSIKATPSHMPMMSKKSSSRVSSPAVFAVNTPDFMLETENLQLGDSSTSKETASCGRSLTGVSSTSVYSSADVAPPPSRSQSISFSTRFGVPLKKSEPVVASKADPALTPLEPLDAMMTAQMGWTNPVSTHNDAEAVMARTVADIYGVPRYDEAEATVEVVEAAPETIASVEEAIAATTLTTPEVATETVAATETDAASEEAAMWAAAAKYETENFDDAYVQEYHRKRQESDGRPRATPKLQINRAQLFADTKLTEAGNINHVYYRSENNYDCDRSPQVRVPAKEQVEQR